MALSATTSQMSSFTPFARKPSLMPCSSSRYCCFDVRPHHVFRGIAEKIPVLLALAGLLQDHHFFRVLQSPGPAGIRAGIPYRKASPPGARKSSHSARACGRLPSCAHRDSPAWENRGREPATRTKLARRKAIRRIQASKGIVEVCVTGKSLGDDGGKGNYTRSAKGGGPRGVGSEEDQFDVEASVFIPKFSGPPFNTLARKPTFPFPANSCFSRLP